MIACTLKLIRVSDYIQHHLDESFNLQQLSEVAGLSRFNFHRFFYPHLSIKVMIIYVIAFISYLEIC